MVGLILCRYDLRKGDLFARNCASVLRVWCGSVCSVSFTGGGGALSRLLCCVAIWFCTICVCIVVRFCLIVSDVVCCGSVSILVV